MNIPVIRRDGLTIPEVWESAVIAAWADGACISTEYDSENGPPSKDCTMIMVVNDPMREPRIHRAFPGGLRDLEIYRQEVLDGIHDSWMEVEGGWHYTYHERLYNYPGDVRTNQVEYIIRKLSDAPYSRRAQAITWNVDLDMVDDPPCLQRVWCRILDDTLNMNTHWRSRDGYKAAFMNMYVMSELQKSIAAEISSNIGREIRVGRYVDISDSFHIYGSYDEEFQGFLDSISSRTFEERTWTTEFAEEIFKESR